MLNIVCMKEQPTQKSLPQSSPPRTAGVGVPADGTCTRHGMAGLQAGRGLEEPPLPCPLFLTAGHLLAGQVFS